MHRIAKFHFVSPSQCLTAMQEEYPQYTEEQSKEMYEALKLPKRATKGSAGYDLSVSAKQPNRNNSQKGAVTGMG